MVFSIKFNKRNKMKLLKLSTTALVCLLAASANADDKAKRDIKDNMQEVYNILPSSVDNLSDAFTKGMFYGRLRMNAFKYDWKNPSSSLKNNSEFGIGGSLIYKTAPFAGFSATAGFYYSDSPFVGMRVDNSADLKYMKSGKDTISRYDAYNSGNYYMAVLGQVYLQYDISKTSFKAGRQIFESLLTASNDTKMIPNTFEGYTVEMKEIPKTTIRAAFLTAEKLRDHTTFCDVITYGDGSSNAKASWNGNDDSVAHQGLSYANFVRAGKDVNHNLIVADIDNKSINNLKIDVTYTVVPDVVGNIAGELNYKIVLPDGYSLTPGIRYMQQFDNGGGTIGGSNLGGNFGNNKGTITNKLGYSGNVHSLDGSISMARLVFNKGALKAQIAYSEVADNADIVAPWRGFPTGGYTRVMAQYNWFANTKTTEAEASYDFGKAQILKGFSTTVRYAIQNFDNAKQRAGVQADSNVLEVDLRQKIAKGLDAKFRLGIASADKMSYGTSAGKDINSYNEYRFEINYVF